jgi:cobalt-zinc-cadmium efflux system outer membrane protein
MLNINQNNNNLSVLTGFSLIRHKALGARPVSATILNAPSKRLFKMVKTLLCFAIFLMLNNKLQAQEAFTLDSIFNRIVQNNPQLKMYDEKIKSQDALVEGAKAWKAPMFGVGTFMTPYSNFSRSSNLRDGSFMLTAEQAIPNKSSLNANRDYLAAQSAITQFAKAESLNELKAFARMYFYEVLVEQKKLDYIQKNITVLINLKKLAEIRYTYNQADLGQIYSLEAKIGNFQNMETTAYANAHIAKIRLNVLMSRPANSGFNLIGELNYSQNLVENIEERIEQRSNVQQYNAQIKSIAFTNKMIATEAKPEFNISFNHMLTYNNVMPNQFSLMAGISIPMVPWAAKGYKSKLKANEFESLAMQQEKQNLINSISGMVLAQQQHIAHMRLELENYEQKIIPALRKSYEVTLLNYQENKDNIINVLNNWKELNDSQLESLNLLNDYYQMYAEYEKNVER